MPLDFVSLQRAAEKTGYEPISLEVIRETERQLGFELPLLLRRLYLEAGDGGFGPGYGFYGLLEGTDEFPDDSVAGLYRSFRSPDPEDPSWSWPEKLLPLVDWGCAIRSCVDCIDPSLPVIRFDPNSDASAMLRPEGYSLEDWLAAWLEGKDLW